MNYNEFIAWAKTLTDKQFAQFFYGAVNERNTSDMSKDVATGHFVLANVEKWYENDKKIEIDISFIALSNGKHYEGDWVDDSPICQSGICQDCKNSISSWAKNMICPICGNEAYGS